MLGPPAFSVGRLLDVGVVAVAVGKGSGWQILIGGKKTLSCRCSSLGWGRLGDTQALTPVLGLRRGDCWHVMASPSSWIANPLCSQSHWTTELRALGDLSVIGERLRILDSRGTKGAGTWRRALCMAQDSQRQGDSKWMETSIQLILAASAPAPATRELLLGKGPVQKKASLFSLGMMPVLCF